MMVNQTTMVPDHMELALQWKMAEHRHKVGRKYRRYLIYKGL